MLWPRFVGGFLGGLGVCKSGLVVTKTHMQSLDLRLLPFFVARKVRNAL